MLTWSLSYVTFPVFTSHLIKTKNRNQSMNKAKNPGYDRGLIYEQPHQESGLCCFSLASYLQKCVTHIYRALYGDAIYLCPSEGHKHGSRKVRDPEQKHLSLSFAIETNNYCSRAPTH